MTRLNALEIIDVRARSRLEGDCRRARTGELSRGVSGQRAPTSSSSGKANLRLRTCLRPASTATAWAQIGGLIFRGADGRLVRTPSAPLIKDLDAQPWPDRERIDMQRYLETWRRFHGKGSVSLITARGCPYRCNWCSHSVYGTTHRRRSPKSVVNEIEWILERYNPEMLWLADDVFTIHHGWLFEFAAEMKRRKIAIPFECITRADRVNEAVAQTLAELRCFRVWIGSESGSQRILDAMQRGVTVQQVRSAVRLCKSQRDSDRHVPDVGL